MFESIDHVLAKLTEQDYIGDKKIGTVVFLAEKLEKPVLVEGPAGVGKTELAKVVAKATGRKLIRLQCYEGLDEAKALYEWEYAKQLLYTQILVDLGVRKMRMITNNPGKRAGIEGYGLAIVDRVPLEIAPNEKNLEYLRTKKEKLGHVLHLMS